MIRCAVSHRLYLCFYFHGYNPALSHFSFWDQHMVSRTDTPRSAWPCISPFSILFCSCHLWMGFSSLKPLDNFSSSPWVRSTYLTQVWWFTMSPSSPTPSSPTHSAQAIYSPAHEHQPFCLNPVGFTVSSVWRLLHTLWFFSYNMNEKCSTITSRTWTPVGTSSHWELFRPWGLWSA